MHQIVVESAGYILFGLINTEGPEEKISKTVVAIRSFLELNVHGFIVNGWT